jgi:hypothetical protein
MLLALALSGSAAAAHPRARAGALLWLPYLGHVARRRGSRPRALLRGSLELPGRLAIDAIEMATLARGSARYRTFFL